MHDALGGGPRGRRVAVGGGILMAASYEARAYGVSSPMGERIARELCPDLLVVPMRPKAYQEASKAVFAIFHDLTPNVEGISVDEAFLDVGGLLRLAGTPEQVGALLRRRVREEVGLPISVGVARTKYLAKIASAVSKPDGLLVVPHDGEEQFLYPLPIERLWGVGKKTSEKLHARGIRTIGQLAEVEYRALSDTVGKASGRHLFALTHFQDPRPVVGAPAPAARCAVDHLEASDLDLRLKSMLKSRHKTILQTGSSMCPLTPPR